MLCFSIIKPYGFYGLTLSAMLLGWYDVVNKTARTTRDAASREINIMKISTHTPRCTTCGHPLNHCTCGSHDLEDALYDEHYSINHPSNPDQQAEEYLQLSNK